jgi:hypothetical protein
MVMVATLTFLAALGFMLLLAGASYLSRGAPVRGVTLIVMVAVLGLFSSLSIYPALRLTHGGTDDGFRVAELDLLRAERDQLLLDVTQRARDNEALSKTSAFFFQAP